MENPDRKANGSDEWQSALVYAQAGDLLYVPRGWVHSAETKEGGPPSLHCPGPPGAFKRPQRFPI